MKRIVAAIALSLFVSGPALAACTTQTFFYNGKITTCTTCCYGNQCSTTCF